VGFGPCLQSIGGGEVAISEAICFLEEKRQNGSGESCEVWEEDQTIYVPFKQEPVVQMT
jgi:hypothetical protein